jgi:hypothetical protein
MSRLLLILALTAVPAIAFADDTTFASVDDATIDTQADNLVVTGIVAGESAARTVSFRFYDSGDSVSGGQSFAAMMQYCEKSALMSMNRPGRYLLTVTVDAEYKMLTACKLKRNQ